MQNPPDDRSPQPHAPRSPARKRLAVFFDGTWNEPPDHTNVRRLRLMLAEAAPDGTPQRAFYDSGVGTRWYDRLSGGMFGAGLSGNVRSGYRWLTENYDPGDEIYIFGFSRGAFTARSLAGLIARCGLLAPNSPISFAQIFERYQRGDAARPIYELIRLKHQNPRQLGFDFEENALLATSFYSRDLITMVGVWDTVGSIGVPFGNFKGVSRRTLRFHNTRLSRAIKHSYHAMAIDEHRKPYAVTLWTEFFPERPPQPAPPGAAPAADHRWIEQRWFSGAHANVGGGYRSDPLPDRPLAWLQQKAAAIGLGFRCNAPVDAADVAAQPMDSYARFLHGVWRIVTLGNRYQRTIMQDPVLKAAHAVAARPPARGWVQTVNERIDPSVFLRCRSNPNYRPVNLVAWASRKNLPLEDIIAAPDRFPEITAPVGAPGIERLMHR